MKDLSTPGPVITKSTDFHDLPVSRKRGFSLTGGANKGGLWLGERFMARLFAFRIFF